jgi:glycosyltransferase involved in cell wall biosynthesis
MSENKTIYHCYSNLLSGGGGVKTYVESLLDYQMPGVSDRVIYSLRDVEQSQFKLLHLHGGDSLGELRGECPVIFTLHNHNAYCPSGTKYLAANKSCCDRQMSYLGCTWGHLVDGCGSRRPHKIRQNLQRAHQELETLKQLKIPVIANSDHVRGQLIKNGLSPEQAVTLRYGIPLPKTSADPLTQATHQNQRILFVGRIVPDKGLDWLLQALKLTDRQIHLDIAGEGWARTRLENLAEKLGVTDRITWHGWCDGEKLDALYQQSFALIFPSLWPEPAGIVTLEAYARYRPVIASAVGGIPEHVQDGETGILVPQSDIKTLAAAITELAANFQKCRCMGEKGNEWFLEEFTIDTHVKRLQIIYEKSIGDFYTRQDDHLKNLKNN